MLGDSTLQLPGANFSPWGEDKKGSVFSCRCDSALLPVRTQTGPGLRSANRRSRYGNATSVLRGGQSPPLRCPEGWMCGLDLSRPVTMRAALGLTCRWSLVLGRLWETLLLLNGLVPLEGEKT